MRRLITTALGLGLIFIAVPQARADEFTSAEFLKWPRENQSAYFSVSIGMAGFIVSMRDKPKARCLEDWYFKDTTRAEDAILSTMRRFPEFHPRGVLVAVLQKQCGELGPDGD